jgi:cbb3-type cytochrome oxidase subunit 3
MTWDSVRGQAATALAAAFGGASLLAGYWALGGTRGLAAATGSADFAPPAWLMWMVALLLAGWVVIVRGAFGARGGDRVRRFCRLGCCVIAIALLGVASDFARSQTLLERLLFAPLLLLLAGAAALLVRDRAQPPRLLPWHV